MTNKEKFDAKDTLNKLKTTRLSDHTRADLLLLIEEASQAVIDAEYVSKYYKHKHSDELFEKMDGLFA